MKLVRERQIYDFTHMRNLRHKEDEHKGMEAKIILKQGRGQNIRDSNTENKLEVAGGVVGRGMG